VGAIALVILAPVVLRNDYAIKSFTLIVMLVTMVASFFLILPPSEGAAGFNPAGGMQNVVVVPWIPAINVDYALGIDGISLPLIILTTVVGVLSMGASWTINRHVKAYCALFLLLQTGILGVFLALDLFLFYVFWEVMLVPMYFLIGIWGGPRRLYAAIKFFLFTLAGGVLMLIALFLLYFASDLTRLTPAQLAAAHITDNETLTAIDKARADRTSVHTFNILALQQLGQHTDVFTRDQHRFLGQTLGWWAFLLLFLGFIVKVPSVPVHTWLPDAHVEAPTPISMILAGVLLKLGGYGILRLCYPIAPEAGYDLDWLVVGLGIISMVYGGFAAMAAKDFKRLVAYSSVSHMGYVLLGIGAWGPTQDWVFGVNGAMFQMIAHGISSTGMFFLVGVLYDRVHHRNLDDFGGVLQKMPLYGAISFGVFFAALGLPGLCGFIGEIMVVLAAWNYNHTLAVIAALVVMITSGYILWTLQRVFFGGEYKGPHGEGFSPMTERELAIGVPILALAILFGVYPDAVLRYTTPTVHQYVENLRDKLPPDATAATLNAQKDGIDETVARN
jgi:NADH-quinone oxidoreductase subunit M